MHYPLFVLLVLILTLGVSPGLYPVSSAATQAQTDERIVQAPTLRVRADSNTESPVIDRLPAGQPVRVIFENDDWAFIEYARDGQKFRGWVAERFLR